MKIIINNKILFYTSLLSKEAFPKGNLIFLHGWGCDSTIFDPIKSEFETLFKEYNLYFLDLPGFGESERISDSMKLNDYVLTVESFVVKLDLKNVILLGHSLGGRIVIKLASSSASYLDKIILIDSAGIERNSRNTFKYFSVLKSSKTLRKLGIKLFGSRDYKSNKEMGETLKQIVNEDLTDLLKNIKTRTLIIWGKADKETPLEDGKRMNNLIKNSKLIVLPNSAHFCFLDNKVGFLNAINEFIKG